MPTPPPTDPADPDSTDSSFTDGEGNGVRDPGSASLAALSWLAVIMAVGVILLTHLLGAGAGGAPREQPSATTGVLKLLARYAVGASELAAGAAGKQATDQLLEPLTSAAVSYDDRLRVALVAIELDRPEEAALQIRGLAADDQPGSQSEAPPDENIPDSEHAASEESDVTGRDASTGKTPAPPTMNPVPDYVREDARRIHTLIEGGAEALSPDDRQTLVDHHDWYAEIALTTTLPDTDPARIAALAPALRVLYALLSLTVLAGGALLVGLVAFIVMLMRLSRGTLRFRYAPPTPGGSVYLETFALFLLGFLGVQALSEVITATTGMELSGALVWLLPMILLWPLFRGSRRVELKYALGWHRGEGFIKEIGAGMIGYLAGLPIVLLGFLMTFVIMGVMSMISPGPSAPPTHPVIDRAADSSLWGIASLYLLGSVWAPLTEESMFRGALLHHLRGARSAIAGALLVGFIFAIIHPQGIALVPPLMALGFNFSMIRQWRGSIIGAMAAHAVHNAVLMTMLIVAMS